MEGERGDPLEGVAEYQIQRLSPAHELLPRYADEREAVGLPRGGVPENVVYMNNVVRYVAPPSYLFCCSARPDFSRCKEKREAIVRVKDMTGFAVMVRAGRPDLLASATLGPVRYQARSVNPFDAGLLDVDPFCKSSLFAFEDELRICWPTMFDTQQYVRIQAPLAAGYLERIA